MTKLPIFQTRNPPKSSEATHVIWRGSCRHLQQRPPDRGQGPLHLAAMEGHLEVVQALLAAGASVDVKDSDGPRPSETGPM